MTKTGKLLSAGAAALLVSAQLTAHAVGQEAAFAKKGASQAQQKHDSDRCWRLAQKTRLTEEQANQNLVAAYIVGGIIGVLVVSAANEEANKDPKSFHRRQAHDDCMAKRGYRKAE